MRKLIVIAFPILLISLMSVSVSAKVFSATAHVSDEFSETWDMYVTIDDQAHTWTVRTQTNDWLNHGTVFSTCEGIWDEHGYSNQTGPFNGPGCSVTIPTYTDIRNTVITYPYYGGNTWAYTKAVFLYYTGNEFLDADVYVDTCTAPKTCKDVGRNCGTWTNNCGQTLNCGTCGPGGYCNMPQGVCGYAHHGGCTRGCFMT